MKNSKMKEKLKCLWIRQIGSSVSNYAYNLAIDVAGNAYITGHTYGEIESGQAKGGEDAFVSKFSKTGKLLWTRQIGSRKDEYPNALAIDAAGNAFIVGNTKGEMESGQAKGKDDIFISKFSTSGKHLWTKQIGTREGDYAKALATDAAGNIFVAGETWGEMESGQAKGEEDAFISKLSKTGELLWSKQLGTNKYDYGNTLTIDQAGNVFVAGETWGEMESGQDKDGRDFFISKFLTSGKHLWTRQIDLSDYDYAQAQAIDQAGNVFITGGTEVELEGEQVGISTDAFISKHGLVSIVDPVPVNLPEQEGLLRPCYHEAVVDELGHLFVLAGKRSRGTTLAKLSNRGEQLAHVKLPDPPPHFSTPGGPHLGLSPQGDLIYNYHEYHRGGDQLTKNWVYRFDAELQQLSTAEFGSILSFACLCLATAPTESGAFFSRGRRHLESWTGGISPGIFWYDAASNKESVDLDFEDFQQIFSLATNDQREVVLLAHSQTSNLCLHKYQLKDGQITNVWSQAVAIDQEGQYSGHRIAMDSADNIFVIGYRIEGEAAQASIGILSKYRADGTHRWTKDISATQDKGLFAHSIHIDRFDNIWICGATQLYKPGVEPQTDTEAFVAKYDQGGSQTWLDLFGTGQGATATSVVVDPLSHVFVLGSSRGALGQSVPAEAETQGFIKKYIDDISNHIKGEQAIEELKSKQAIYSILHGHPAKDLDTSLLEEAEKRMQGQGDGRISEADAQALVKQAKTADGTIDEAGQKTLAFIYTRYKLTPPAQKVILAALQTE